MEKIVIIKNMEPVTTSLAIADGVGLPHKSVIQLIRKYEEDLNDFGLIAFQMRLSKRGKPVEFAYLNEPQTTLLISFMRNSITVIEFKKNLVKEFYNMKKTLNDVYIRQNSAEWIETRAHGKISRKAETDTIKAFVEYAQSQGSQNAARYYVNITKMENKALFFLEQKFDNIRQLLTGQQLMVLSTADQVVEKALKDGMESAMPYKDIYQMAKERVEKFASVLPKTPVVMLSEIKQLKGK